MRRLLSALLACVLLAGPAFPTGSTFNGLDSSMSNTDAPVGANGTNFSLGCWVRRTGAGELGVATLMRIANSATATTGNGFILHWNNALLEYHFTSVRATTNWVHELDEIQTPGLNVWFHLGLVYVSAGPTIVWYVNGEVATGGTQTTGAGAYRPVVLTDSVVLGTNTGGTSTWAGQLASCFIYDRLLFTNEMKQIKNCGPHTIRRNLIWSVPLGLFGGRDYSNTRHPALTTTNTTIFAGGPPVGCPQGGGWAE
jgi:hypothetical protein